MKVSIFVMLDLSHFPHMLAINKPFSPKCDEYITECEKVSNVALQVQKLSHFNNKKFLSCSNSKCKSKQVL